MLGHVPRAEQAPLLASIATWLCDGGHVLATMGTANADDEVYGDWLGAPMFFASFDEAANRRMLADAGIELIEAEVIPIDEAGHGPVSFMWALGSVAAALRGATTTELTRRSRVTGGKGSPVGLL
jgi:hypothetical protein